MRPFSYGSGRFERSQLGTLGAATIIEEGVLIIGPECVHLGARVYVGHRTMLVGDTRGDLRVHDGAWIGPDCYMQAAGGITIGANAGIGPRVMIITSTHAETAPPAPIIDAPLQFAAVEIGAGADIGIGAVLLPGAKVGAGTQIGAGAVVTGEIAAGVVAVGMPARAIRRRGERQDR